MEQTNFCRQMVKQFIEEAGIPSVADEIKQFKSHCIDLARASQKFILPDGGIIYDDPDYRALDETIQLSLPYPIICIEFFRTKLLGENPAMFQREGFQSTKGFLFARELDAAIVITMLVWGPARKWIPYPEVAIPRTKYIDRTQRKEGYAQIKVVQNIKQINGIPILISDYSDEVVALIGMLNVLHCKNVHTEKIEVSKTRKAIHSSKKAALPFDTYHVLTIDAPGKPGEGERAGGNHRSPREHLRRGHIRRLGGGRRIWVNATVVAVGCSGGTVKKDYALRRSV